MTIAILIISTISIILNVFLIISTKRIFEQNNALIVGLHESIALSQILYMYQQYFLSSTKVNLEFVQTKSAEMIQKCIKEENFEEAKFIQKFCEAINQLKNMEAKDIEEYEE